MKHSVMLSSALVLGSMLSPVALAVSADQDLIKRGEYLATAGDCVACHTAEHEGKPFAGGLSIDTPLGHIISSNITPSKDGIGDYSYEDFDRAVRQGIRADGNNLYPAMPYTAYAKVTDEDMQALYAYFMHGVEPVDGKPEATELPFPFNIRESMAVWNGLFLDDEPFTPDPDQSDEWNRGAYLAQGLTHCATCHTPRNPLMAEDSGKALAGASLGTWYAPNITSDDNSGIGTWTHDDIVSYLKAGYAPDKSQAAGPMAEAISHSLQHLSDEDLSAIAVWLKTVPAVSDANDTQPSESYGQVNDNIDSVFLEDVPASTADMSGAQLYNAACASCHQADGTGNNGLPSLVNNTVLGRQNTDNVVMAILEGVQYRNHIEESHGTNMPAFAHEFNDEQVARVSNYILSEFGREEVADITADEVAVLRSGGPASPLLPLARWGMGIGAVFVLGLIAWFLRRKRKG
ncbi:cytochrome c [Marinomonas ostreistagni]|uniref:cytochrome c n=1 Tax=Marinomonas ostreistagni TaxID=359209 RepID=UPI001950D00F|nr:cytochrome c [Marinomonas ostreistagni]MBM6551843.1 cytochrome c [Marinomonas ostreistagni]